MMDSQELVEVKVYEGENSNPDENLLLGKFMVEGLGKFAAGNPILLNFDLDLNGMLNVTATEKKTGLSKSVRIDTGSSSRLFDLDNAKKNLLEIIDEDFDKDGVDEKIPDEKKSTLLLNAKNLKKRAESLLSKIDEADAIEIKNLLHETSIAISSNNESKLLELIRIATRYAFLSGGLNAICMSSLWKTVK